MRRVVLAVLVLPLLVACSGAHPSDFVAGHSRVKVDSPDLVAMKKTTDVPNCPRTSGTAVAGARSTWPACAAR